MSVIMPLMKYDRASDSAVCGVCSLCSQGLLKPLDATSVHLHCDRSPPWKIRMCACMYVCICVHVQEVSVTPSAVWHRGPFYFLSAVLRSLVTTETP